LYAALVVLLLLILVQREPILPGAGLNLEGAKALYWSLAPLGLLGFAYGFRILSQTFWRAYALVFTADITFRFMMKFGWVPIARLVGYPENSRHDTSAIVFAFVLVATTCLALLRYGGWLPTKSPEPVETRSRIQSPPIVERTKATTPHWPRYSIAHCALASLAGAICSATVFRLLFGEWGWGFATIEFVIAFAALLCGGRSWARQLTMRGKDSFVRGAALGAMAGASVGALIALLFAGALLHASLFAHPAALAATAFLGLPFGLLNGALVGGALVLLGKRSSAKSS
jgi:hypothetical protein